MEQNLQKQLENLMLIVNTYTDQEVDALDRYLETKGEDDESASVIAHIARAVVQLAYSSLCAIYSREPKEGLSADKLEEQLKRTILAMLQYKTLSPITEEDAFSPIYENSAVPFEGCARYPLLVQIKPDFYIDFGRCKVFNIDTEEEYDAGNWYEILCLYLYNAYVEKQVIFPYMPPKLNLEVLYVSIVEKEGITYVGLHFMAKEEEGIRINRAFAVSSKKTLEDFDTVGEIPYVNLIVELNQRYKENDKKKEEESENE